MMTEAQRNYLASLAREAGYQSLYYAAAPILGRSVSNMQRKGLTKAEASRVIDALKEAK
jgi:hypothetical protein